MKEKNPYSELIVHLKENFRMPNPNMYQFRDEHITVDVFGRDVQIWNNLNMRYYHRRFLSTSGNLDGAYTEALYWLINEYKGERQAVPEHAIAH